MNKIEQKIKEWRTHDLLDDEIVDRILAYEKKSSKVEKQSFLANIVPFLIALLVAFAILALVGSNWNEYNQLIRLVIIIVTLICFHAAAFVSYQKGKELFGHCLNFINVVAYAAAFILIVQMYQFSSDSPIFLITWSLLAFLYFYYLKHDMFFYLFLGIGFFSLSYSLESGTTHVFLLQLILLICSFYYLKIINKSWNASFNYTFLGYIIINIFGALPEHQYITPTILVLFTLWYLNERGIIDYKLLPFSTPFVWVGTFITTMVGEAFSVIHEMQNEFSHGIFKPIAVPLFNGMIAIILLLAIHIIYQKWKTNKQIKSYLWIFLFIFLLPILGIRNELANTIMDILLLFAYTCLRLFQGVSRQQKSGIIIGFLTFTTLVIGIYVGISISFISKSIIFIILAIILYFVFFQSKKVRGVEVEE